MKINVTFIRRPPRFFHHPVSCINQLGKVWTNFTQTESWTFFKNLNLIFLKITIKHRNLELSLIFGFAKHGDRMLSNNLHKIRYNNFDKTWFFFFSQYVCYVLSPTLFWILLSKCNLIRIRGQNSIIALHEYNN